MQANAMCDGTPGCSLSKLGQCEVCAVQEAKYTCPQCELKTCSLNCSKIHKVELECDGQRNRTKFIPVSKFTNLDLLSDYKLLEEISRSLETSKKKFGKRRYISEYLIKLRNAAKARKIDLKFLPFNFEKRRSNTTFLKFKDNSIYWQIEWVFVNADNTRLSEGKISENDKISSIIAKYFELQLKDPLYEKLQFYQAAGLSGVKIFLKAEQRSGNKYHEVDVSDTIKETLYSKVIIEYPTFFVVLKDHSNFYDIIDSDGEGEIGKVRSGKEIVESIINKVETENNTMKNLLFISGCSEDELSSE